MTSVVSIVGDYFHDETAYREFLDKCAADADLTVQHRTIDELGAVLDENPDLLVFALENRINPLDEVVYTWFTPEFDQKIVDYVSNGGHLIAWHPALASYPEDSGYIEMLRGYFVSHPVEHPLVKYTGKSEMFGDVGFEFNDEQYFVNVKTDETTVFLTSASVCGESLAGWTHDFGDGRVLCICPSHTDDGRANPGLRSLFAKCLEYMS